MRTTLTLTAMLAPTLAAADPGHIAEVMGHSHWVAGAAIAAAAALGLLAWGKKGAAEKDAETEDADEKPEGASA